METINCQKDLQYVNKKLAMWLDIQVWKKSRASKSEEDPRGIPVTNNKSFYVRPIPYYIKISRPAVIFRQVASDPNFDRHFVSPDSTIPCDDPECPIQMPHNTGRFYVDGQRADSPIDIDYETSSGGLMVPASHYFNYTVPPPDITEAYLKTAEGLGSTEDNDVVRRYKMKHCFSPVISECPSPGLRSPCTDLVSIPCLVFDPEIYDAKHQEWLYRMLEKDVDKEVDDLMKPIEPIKEPQKTQDGSHGPSNCCNGKCPPIPPRRSRLCSQRTMMRNSKAPRQDRPSSTDQCGERPAKRSQHDRQKLRRIPKGENLRGIQLTLQERIVNQIAERAVKESRANSLAGSPPCISTSSGHNTLAGSTHGSFTTTRSDETCISSESPEHIDRKLDFHAALTKKLTFHLQDDLSIQSISLLDRNGAEMETTTKFVYMSSVLLIVRYALRQLLGDFTRAYRPSGMVVTTEEMEGSFEEYLAVYEMLLEKYPYMATEDIIGCLDKVGRRARLEDLC